MFWRKSNIMNLLKIYPVIAAVNQVIVNGMGLNVKITATAIIIAIIALISVGGCVKEKTAKYRIGFSQCTSADQWRKSMNQEMKRTAFLRDSIELEIKDANSDSQTQIKQIMEFINSGVNLLIISPNEAAPLTSVIVEAHRRNIPIILIDRKIDSSDYDAFVGGDNYSIGYEAGRNLARISNGKGNILEVSGLAGSSPASDRHNGFVNAIKNYPDLKIIKTLSGAWNEEDAFNAVSKYSNKSNIGIVFAHNDVMAIGARSALGSLSNGMIFIGVDGLSGKDCGIQKVIDGQITFTLYYPTGAKEAIDIAIKIMSKNGFNKYNLLPTIVIDKANASTIEMEAQLIQNYMGEIDMLQGKMQGLVSRYLYLQSLTNLASVGLMLFLGLTLVTWNAYHKKNILNKKQLDLNALLIDRQNDIISQNGLLADLNVQMAEQKEQLRIHETQLENLVDERTKELKAEKFKAQESDRLKSSFLSNVSHEIRTPLNAIVGFSTLLNQSELPEESKREFTQIIANNAESLLMLINNIIELSIIEANLLHPNMDLFYINDLLNELGSTLKLDSIIEKRASLVVKLARINVLFHSDKSRITQIISHLVNNAFKFTEDGIIELGFEMQNEEGVFFVKDSGTGIADENMEKLFKSFVKIDDSQTKLFRGVGIGLVISKKLAEILGGKLWFESKLGVGSTFFLSFPKSYFINN